MLGVKTTLLKLPWNEESWKFYQEFKEANEFDGAEIRMYSDGANDLMVIEYDSVFDTNEILEGLKNV